MTETHADEMPWSPGSPLFRPSSIHEGKELVTIKILSDRRGEGAGIALLMKFAPPPGKVIRIVAVARSDEHIFALEGGRGTKSGQQPRRWGSWSTPARLTRSDRSTSSTRPVAETRPSPSCNFAVLTGR
jgi:hypothetical protein